MKLLCYDSIKQLQAKKYIYLNGLKMVEDQADIRNEPIQLTINNDGYTSMDVWNLPSEFLMK